MVQHRAAGMVEPGGFLEAAMLNHTLVSIVDDNQPFRESLRKLSGVRVKLPNNEIFLGTRPTTEPFRVCDYLPRLFLHDDAPAALSALEASGHLMNLRHAATQVALYRRVGTEP